MGRFGLYDLDFVTAKRNILIRNGPDKSELSTLTLGGFFREIKAFN